MTSEELPGGREESASGLRPGTGEPPSAAGPAEPEEGGEHEEGGEPACWAHLVCPECGAMTSEGHRSFCTVSVR